jgi:NAD+ synthase
MRELDYNLIIEKIQSFIRSIIQAANAKKIVLGLSGGIDSSVTATLCVNTIGRNNVYGLSLPCESISQDLRDAQLIASELKIKFKVIDLTSFYMNFKEKMDFFISSNQLSLANLKSRLRMVTLYYYGQSLGNALIAGTGNRAELAIGYFTKYGDGGVDFEPLGALYKNEVRKIARILNVPDPIIKKPPSPGLWAGQTDEGEIGLTYDTIDEILYRLDYNKPLDGLNKKDIEKVQNLMKSAEHKLKMPPTFIIN